MAETVAEIIELLTGIERSVSELEGKYTKAVLALGNATRSSNISETQQQPAAPSIEELRSEARHALTGITSFLGLYHDLVSDLRNAELISEFPGGRPRQGGLSPADLEVLFRSKQIFDEQSEPGECSVCFSDFSPGEEVASLPCKHNFHVHCIERWLKVAGNCPLCRCDCRSSKHTGSVATPGGHLLAALGSASEGVTALAQRQTNPRSRSSGPRSSCPSGAPYVTQVRIDATPDGILRETLASRLRQLPASGEGACEFDMRGPGQILRQRYSPAA